MICCGPSRRDVLRVGAILAGASLAALPGRARGAAEATPVNLELVTLTETEAVLTWYTGVPGTDDGLGRMEPAPAGGEVWYGTSPAALTQIAGGQSGTPYHYAEITGLEPGRTYYYKAVSDGKAATATFLAAGQAAGAPTSVPGVFSFTTPQPPPGRFLFAVALCNDLHLGETVAGLVGGLDFIKGISQVPGRPPYPEVMTGAMVADARRRGATYLLAAGDLTSEAEPADLARAKQLLDGFGTYERDYFVARGNHDRAHAGAEWESCTPGRWQGNDCYRDAFNGGSDPTYFAQDLNGLRVIGLDTYDKAGDGGDAGGVSAEQMAWLRAELRLQRDRPTIVFGHHPLLTPDAPQAVTGGSGLDVGQAAAVMLEYTFAPGVFLHHAGHTHRNKRFVLPGTTGVVQQEVAAAKEYPGGFTLLRLHEGGYALNFYKTRDPLAREWSERSRQELAGLWPQLSLGNAVSDRNTMVRRNLSGLRRPDVGR